MLCMQGGLCVSSTPVGQGIPFPLEAPAQRKVHHVAKKSNGNRPVTQAPVPMLSFSDKRRNLEDNSLPRRDLKRQK